MESISRTATKRRRSTARFQKEFEKQKVKIPAIDLDFFALSGVWIIAMISAIVATLLNNQVTFMDAEKIADLHDPWIIFDARSAVARAMSYAWLIALVVSPVIIIGTLLYMTFAAAWINGFVGSWYAYAASAAAIGALAILGCHESCSAAYSLNKSRRAYWIFGNGRSYPLCPTRRRVGESGRPHRRHRTINVSDIGHAAPSRELREITRFASDRFA